MTPEPTLTKRQWELLCRIRSAESVVLYKGEARSARALEQRGLVTGVEYCGWRGVRFKAVPRAAEAGE